LKFVFALFLSAAFATGVHAQSSPAATGAASAKTSAAASAATNSAPAKPAAKRLTKEEARQKFVLDVVHTAVALPVNDPQDRLRVLHAAVRLVAHMDQSLALQYAKEGSAIEARLVAEGQTPAVSMMSAGYVDCEAAVTLVQSVPPNNVADADATIVGAITACPKQTSQAAKQKLEAAVGQGIIAGRPILTLMTSEGMDSQWSRSMFVEIFGSLPADAASFADQAPNYAAMYSQLARQMDKDTAKAAAAKFLGWLANLPDSAQRNVAINLTANALSAVLGDAAYQDLLRSDPSMQQTINSALGKDTSLPPPANGNAGNTLPALDATKEHSGQLQAMSPSVRAREAAANGYSSGSSGDRKAADHYFDIAFASLDEMWSERADSNVNASEVVQEVSDAAAQIDPVAALQHAQRLQDPAAQAISMLAVAKTVMDKQ